MTDEELQAMRERVQERSAGCVQRDAHVAADGNALLAEVDRLRGRLALADALAAAVGAWVSAGGGDPFAIVLAWEAYTAGR